MNRYLIAFLASLFLATGGWSQENEPDDVEASDLEEAAEEAEAGDDSDLDAQVYEDADDDFRPSEEISTDQSIAFPTDI